MPKQSKKSAAKRPETVAAIVAVILKRTDAGQIIDGLRSRMESWDTTAEYLESDGSARSAEDWGTIEECSDEEEARNIAGHYREVINAIETQIDRANPRVDWCHSEGIGEALEGLVGNGYSDTSILQFVAEYLPVARSRADLPEDDNVRETIVVSDGVETVKTTDCSDRDENIAAISAEMHSDKKWDEFYSRFCDEVSGFPGFWRYSIEAADAFTKVERELKAKWGQEGGYEYPESIFDFVAAIMDADKLPNAEQLEALALKAIEGNKN